MKNRNFGHNWAWTATQLFLEIEVSHGRWKLSKTATERTLKPKETQFRLSRAHEKQKISLFGFQKKLLLFFIAINEKSKSNTTHRAMDWYCDVECGPSTAL